MEGNAGNNSGQRGSWWRLAAWTGAALLLLLPLVAMQFTDEVVWTASDFVFAAVLLFGSLGVYELVARKTSDTAYRAAVSVALAAAFLLIWLNGAVGIIGSEDNPANLMYGGVLLAGIIGALVARFQPRGMARALLAVALMQAAVTIVALVTGWGIVERFSWWDTFRVVGLNGFFVVLWVGSALLFQKATYRRPKQQEG